jgi:hypothetical protein
VPPRAELFAALRTTRPAGSALGNVPARPADGTWSSVRPASGERSAGRLASGAEERSRIDSERWRLGLDTSGGSAGAGWPLTILQQ